MSKKPPRPKKSPAKNEYQLDNGRRIRLQALNQSRWPEVLGRNGVMCFTPNAGTFPALFEIVVEDAKAMGARSTPYLIPPAVRLAEYQRDSGRLKLPLWVCTAEFTSSEPVEDSMSTLTVVWFQEEMALPIDPGVLKQLRAINWLEMTAPPATKIQSQFIITEEQQKRIAAWFKKQDAKAARMQQKSGQYKDWPWVQEELLRRGRAYYGTCGGGLTYHFSPVGTGAVFTVSHDLTKETLDLTEYYDPDEGTYNNVVTPWSPPPEWEEAAELEEVEALEALQDDKGNVPYRFLGDRDGKVSEKFYAELAQAKIDGMQPLMTPAQVAEAKKLIPGWKPKK